MNITTGGEPRSACDLSKNPPEMDVILPVRVTEYFSSLATEEEDDPIGMQFRATPKEGITLPYESDDPLAEETHSPLPRLIHRYPSRALVLVTDSCAIHCRFCFRRYFTGTRQGALTNLQLEEILAYVRRHTEIDEILLSGGDPLALEDEALLSILSRFRMVRKDLTLRICTRIPSVEPGRITQKLCKLISDNAPIWVVAQFNHPREITPECISALSAITGHGVPVVSQTVLLRGINDDPAVLSELFRKLVRNHVKPYYLFQGDLAQGTSHFRIPLNQSLEIVSQVRRGVSRLAMPLFALDVPNGGGKIELTDMTVTGPADGWFLLRTKDGIAGRYPAEE